MSYHCLFTKWIILILKLFFCFCTICLEDWIPLLHTEHKFPQTSKQGKKNQEKGEKSLRIEQQPSSTFYLPVYQESLVYNKLWLLLLCSTDTVEVIQIDLHYKHFTWGQSCWSLAIKQSSPDSFSYDMSRTWGQGGTLWRWIIALLGSVFIQQWVTFPW